MIKAIVIVGAALAAVAFAADTNVVTPSPIQAEREKLASKDWRHYRGCEDTCFSLCLENPTGFDSKCSTLFSNNTIASVPKAESCKSPEAIQSCTYQCSCSCKRCSFCKQDLAIACADDLHPADCLDHVIDNIITKNKCD